MKKDSKFHLEALTFDDVLLVPSYSEVIPSATNVKTKLTKNIDLNIPSIPACLQLHNIDVIVRIRTLKEKKS